MNFRCAKILFAAALFCLGARCSAAEKPRVFVLTDIENEPDDAMSLVRFLVYANQWDVEGLVATTSIHQQNKVAPERIRQIVAAYGQVRDNLEKHERGFPPAAQLHSVISEGRRDYGMRAVGEGMDSPGSALLIRAADRDDPRPLWVPVWGGPNVLAQALWKVRATRSPEALARFVAPLRVYTISDQDDSGPWLRTTFPALFYIASRASTPAAPTITRRGAESVATHFTAASPAPISQSWTTRGSTNISAAKVRSVRSIRRRRF
jgi:hypothetical protein